MNGTVALSSRSETAADTCGTRTLSSRAMRSAIDFMRDGFSAAETNDVGKLAHVATRLPRSPTASAKAEYPSRVRQLADRAIVAVAARPRHGHEAGVVRVRRRTVSSAP